MFCRACGAALLDDSRFCSGCGTRVPETGAGAAPERADPLLGTRISDYVIEDWLGEGGMGVVYRARHALLDQPVAVKILAPHLARDARVRERFLQEGRILVELRHPNIVQLFTATVIDDRLALVMELIEGEPLDDRLARDGAFPLDVARDTFRQLLDAVGAAHDRGVVHRDLKPGNVMIREDGVPMLMDFGIARVLGASRLTSTGAAIGTPHYMAPEQVLGETDIDARADVYALAATFFEMLTGRAPFDHLIKEGTDQDFLVKNAHVHEQPRDLRTYRPEAPNSWADAVAKGLAKRRADRFPTCAAFAAALAEGPRPRHLGPAAGETSRARDIGQGGAAPSPAGCDSKEERTRPEASDPSAEQPTDAPEPAEPPKATERPAPLSDLVLRELTASLGRPAEASGAHLHPRISSKIRSAAIRYLGVPPGSALWAVFDLGTRGRKLRGIALSARGVFLRPGVFGGRALTWSQFVEVSVSSNSGRRCLVVVGKGGKWSAVFGSRGGRADVAEIGRTLSRVQEIVRERLGPT